MKNPTLCLNMIVKNESKIITRLLGSVCNIIDAYCICDTGSTDDTISIITDFFISKNIPGKIIMEPFKNFEYNRNIALQSALGMSDFLLLMDADMILDVCNFEKKQLLKHDTFYILQGTEQFYYKNMRIIRNNGLYFYEGVTHEYIKTPPNTISTLIPKANLFIKDVGDGGCKTTKFERDIGLLTAAIQDEPNNERYVFYLANSYFDTGNFEKAIEFYKKRITMIGWNQEVWYSHYRVGRSYSNMGNISEAIYHWLAAYNVLPTRIEGIYEIIKHYREISHHVLCKHFYKLAIDILADKTRNIDDHLFLHNDVYTYKLYYEYTIFAAYIGIKDINTELIHVLNNCNNADMNSRLLKNMKFYKNILKPTKLVTKDDTIAIPINTELVEFKSSSSCLIPSPYKSGYLMNMRYVNYFINPNGRYKNGNKSNDNIITVNKYLELDKDLNIVYEKIFDTVYIDRLYIGIEDIRIYHDNYSKKLLFIGTGYHANNSIGIVDGEYNINKSRLIGNELNAPFHKASCQKNWVYIDYNKETHIIYKWNPLQICRIDDNRENIQVVKTMKMPKIFNHVRGSSCGFKYKGELWFVVHLVSYESPRHYYHMIVVLNDKCQLLRYSAPFKFEGECIEYCLSIIVEDKRVLMNYSTWDRTTRIGIYDKKYIDCLISYS
jgi:tetratricopeptide (TPR) repeat protein